VLRAITHTQPVCASHQLQLSHSPKTVDHHSSHPLSTPAQGATSPTLLPKLAAQENVLPLACSCTAPSCCATQPLSLLCQAVCGQLRASKRMIRMRGIFWSDAGIGRSKCYDLTWTPPFEVPWHNGVKSARHTDIRNVCFSPSAVNAIAYASLAQLVEHETLNLRAAGSSPARGFV
jgi:hypothetical protein